LIDKFSSFDPASTDFLNMIFIISACAFEMTFILWCRERTKPVRLAGLFV
jgi:hypothetical protein